MLFRRIIVSALCVGLISGVLMTLLQQLNVAPILFAAEAYETKAEHPESTADGHSHDDGLWAPADGMERMFYSIVSNVLVGIGFAAVLIALMSQLQLRGIARLNVVKGILWGIAGYVVFFAAPGLGLPPEIPGVNAAPLEHRQAWWLFTAVSTAVGMGLLVFAPTMFRVLGGALLALPHLIGAPRVEGPEFAHPNPDAVIALTHLHHDFIVASAVVNLLFWITLGVISSWTLHRWVLKDLQPRT